MECVFLENAHLAMMSTCFKEDCSVERTTCCIDVFLVNSSVEETNYYKDKYFYICALLKAAYVPLEGITLFVVCYIDKIELDYERCFLFFTHVAELVVVAVEDH